MFKFHSFFPFNKEMQEMLEKVNPAEIQKFVHESISKAVPPTLPQQLGQMDFFNNAYRNDQGRDTEDSKPFPADRKYKPKVFETHNEVYVQLDVKNTEKLKELKVFHTSSQLIIEGLPDKGEPLTLSLPAIVKKKESRARYKDGILEIKLIKWMDHSYTQIDIKGIESDDA